MGRFSFPRSARLLSGADFRRVYRRGVRMRAAPLRLCALRRSEGESRLGLSIGRRVGNAVQRNRWKRAVREAFRLNRHKLREPHDLGVSIDWAAPPDQSRRVADSLGRLIAELNAGDPGGGGERGDT